MGKKMLLLVTCLFVGIGLLTAQTQRITGVVMAEEDGLPVVGASVLVKGTTLGTITDMDGNFQLANVPTSATLLQVSYIGMRTLEVPIKPNLRIVLKSDTEVLDEVIVTAYGTSTKGAFTGSASVMKADKIEKRQVSSVTNALAGAVAGVQVLNDNGQPGSDAKVRIRGVGSINAGTTPLYVVDGVPYDGDLSSLNSADIETMTVLKDAASTALYGARGANGIIMITTKKGALGKARINFDAKWGVNSRAIKTYDVMTSPKTYTETAYQALYNAQLGLGKTPQDANVEANKILLTNQNGGLGYQVYTVPQGEQLIGANGLLNPNATLGYSDGQYYYTPDNWADETFEKNLRQEYNLNISGGNDKGTFYMALGFLDDQGVIPNSGFKRLNGRFKGDYKLYEWLKVGANVAYININSRYPGSQDGNATASSSNAFFIANNIAPVYPLYVRNANKEIMMNNGRKVYDYGDGKSSNANRSFMSIANPAGDLTYDKREFLGDVVNANWFAEITPMAGLVISARYGLNIDNTRYNRLQNTYMGQSASYGGEASQSALRSYGFDQQYVANYQFALQNVHHFDVTLGYDGYTYQYTELSGSGQNLYNPESFYLDNVIDQFRIGGSKDRYATKGFFGRVNYAYNDTYFGNISYRRDASSRFAPDKRWGNFWSASAAWVMTREEFMKDLTWINLLKLKASFGEQGNDDILYVGSSDRKNYYPWQDQYRMTGANGTFSDGTLYYKGNPDITWETSISYNAGIDFALFDNKLSGSIEYFGRKSKDMLYNKPTAGSLGYTAIPMNVGSMTNSGVEIDLNYQILANKNFNWNVNYNATFIHNKINKLHADLNGKLIEGSRIYEEGKSMYRMYLVDYAGVDEETGQALYWAKNEKGEAIRTPEYARAENYKVATDGLLPTVYGGFGTSLQAYGFDASIQLSYQLGGKIFDSGYRALMHGGNTGSAGRNWHKDIRNAWTPENKATNVPRLNSSDKYTNALSTRWLVSSDYLSLNNITIGYTFPQQWVKKIMFEKARIYLTADNIAFISARKGLDPRQSYVSSTTSLYTPIRTVSGGISLTF